MSSERRYALIGHAHSGSLGDLLSTNNLSDVTDAPTSLINLGLTAIAAEVNLLDLAGLTVGWVLAADSATTASWQAPAAGGLADIVDDVTPQLGATLDANTFNIDMGTNVLTDTNLGQFITAVGWGDHASGGYAPIASPSFTGTVHIDGTLFMLEQGVEDASESTYGQIWVKNSTPQQLWWTDEGGTGRQLGIDYTGIYEPVDADIARTDVNDVVTAEWNVPAIIRGKVADYTMVLGDAGQVVRFTGATAAQTFTIPANASVVYPIGTMIGIENDGSVAISLAITTDTMTWSKDNTTGTRTLAAGASAVILKTTATTWKVSGSALVT